MDRLPIEEGRVVLSTQGRDRGRYFVVLSIPEEGYALCADGLTRRLDHPKKKKVIHIRPKPLRLALDGGYPSGRLQDSDIRAFLRENGCGPEQPLCKED
ncbi:MAG: KOW domain-containing RNA-binding protein [Clostridia bacterium]|nr:KOW domain-containing RNA-binding protein [Clostridia bacterium]